MANRKPLVLVSGEPQQLQTTDTLVDASGNQFNTGAIGGVYSTTVGDGAASSFTVTHALNSNNVAVIVTDIASGDVVAVDWTILSVNAISVGTFTPVPTTNQYRVVVMLGGGVTGATGSTGPSVSPVPYTQNDEGAITIPDTGLLTQPKRLIVSGTNRATLSGTARAKITDSFVDSPEHPLTQQRAATSLYLGPDETLTLFDRVQLNSATRLSAVGNSRVQVLSPRSDGAEVYMNNPPDPATTASLTFIMAGLAGRITAGVSGAVFFSITGRLYNSGATAGWGAACKIAFGTGTPPVQGVALTGTAIGTLAHFISGAAAGTTRSPFNVVAVVKGLTPGVTYWFDLQYEATGGGTGVVDNAYLLAYRL